MLTWEEIWPPYGVRLTEGDLVLTVVNDGDVPGLVEIALAGVHAPGEMPFSTPWTDDDPAALPANNVRYHSSVRAGFTAARFDLLFAVRVDGELVGVQGLHAQDFAVTRTLETGSWLGRAFQGRGIGTRMRQAVCAFAFDALGAAQVTSGAFLDNPASLAVSRKVGYRPNGTVRLKRKTSVAVNQRLVLTPDTFVRGRPVQLEGIPALRRFLELEPTPLHVLE